MKRKYSCIDPRCAEILSERHVQAIWYDYNLRPKNLVTREGALVRVVHPGVWNQEAGPDFRGAVLEVTAHGRSYFLRGDVEVHLSPRDWTLHGHAGDPRYKSVIAHVTWSAGDAPETLPKGTVSIALGDTVRANPAFSLEQIDLAAYPFGRLPATRRPCQERLERNPAITHDLLGEAGRFRLEVKARRIGLLLAAKACSRTQLFYEEVMAALGYKENKQNFRTIAQTIPYDRLIAEPENAASALQSAGGFIFWNRNSMRPSNSPLARLSAAAALFTATDIMSALETDDFSPAGCRGLIRLLTQQHIMGRGRAAAILSNVIVPFALYDGRVKTLIDWLPPEDVSQPIRLMAFRLLGRDHDPAAMYARDGLRLQGLLQIERAFCKPIHPECATCYLSQEGRFPAEDTRVEYGT